MFQLFINYKLKSVAHMPWKAMVYKSLNTFIDGIRFRPRFVESTNLIFRFIRLCHKDAFASSPCMLSG